MPFNFPSQSFTFPLENIIGLWHAIWDQDMKLKILTRRDREGGSWDTSFFPLSFLLLRLSAFLLGALIYFFTAFLSLSHLKWVKMGQNGSKNLAWVIMINSLNSTPPGEPPSHARLKIRPGWTLHMESNPIFWRHLCLLLHLVPIQPILLPPGYSHPLAMLIKYRQNFANSIFQQ